MTISWINNKTNLRDLVAATGLVILLKLDSNHRFFSPCDLEIWLMTLENYRAPLLHYIKINIVQHFKAIGEFKLKLSYSPATIDSGQNRRFIVPYDLQIWRMTLKNNRAPLLCCCNLCASFHNHRWIQTKVTVPKRSIRVKIGDLLSRVTFKFDGWPWKTKGNLFYVTSSFIHHSISIGEFKLKLQSGNAQFGSTSSIFCPAWPWNLTNDLEKQ